MSELDLIPGHYRRVLGLRRGLVRFVVVYALLVAALVGTRLVLSQRIAVQQVELEALRSARKLSEERQARLVALGSQRQSLSRRLAVLDGLRGGIAAVEMFEVMDRALDEDVWFSRWTFRRAGEVVEKPRETVETGYFIVVPKEAPDGEDRAWRMETHMELAAHARDHSALALFVRRLADQSEIESVRILNTRIQPQLAGDVIDFQLAMLVRSRL